jgi:hypothetical protein
MSCTTDPDRGSLPPRCDPITDAKEPPMYFMHPDDQLMLACARHGELLASAGLDRVVREAKRAHPKKRYALSARRAAKADRLHQRLLLTHRCEGLLSEGSVALGRSHRRGVGS